MNLLSHIQNRLSSIHSDERGTISILTVFALMFFTMVLIMVINVAQHVDDKIKFQNTADASVYSGGVVMARGMNSIAYTNHLLADVFAMTAFLQEAQARDAEQAIPTVLDAWQQLAPDFSRAEFAKFPPLTPLIIEKLPLEQEAVTAWGNMMFTASEEILPVFERILREELITQFQVDVINNMPRLASDSSMEISMRHGLRQYLQQQITGQLREGNIPVHIDITDKTPRGEMYGLLWRPSTVQVIGHQILETDPTSRSLPLLNPNAAYQELQVRPEWVGLEAQSKNRRDRLAKFYLREWVEDKMAFFEDVGKMSQFHNLFFVSACGKLGLLLDDSYPDSNLPMMLRPSGTLNAGFNNNSQLENDYQFVGISYRRHLPEMGQLMFRNPLASKSDAMAFAQIELYIPQPRLRCCPWLVPIETRDGYTYADRTDYWPRDWDSFSQNWTVRLTPATHANLKTITETAPNVESFNLRVLSTQQLSELEFQTLNTH